MSSLPAAFRKGFVQRKERGLRFILNCNMRVRTRVQVIRFVVSVVVLRCNIHFCDIYFGRNERRERHCERRLCLEHGSAFISWLISIYVQ